jgi:hypothetical protein
MAARSEAEANSLLVYKSPAWKGGVLYLTPILIAPRVMVRGMKLADCPISCAS